MGASDDPAQETKKFHRANRGREWIAGVRGGLARCANIDPLLARVLWIALTLIPLRAGLIA